MKQVRGFKYILEFFGSDLFKNVFQIETANNVPFFHFMPKCLLIILSHIGLLAIIKQNFMTKSQMASFLTRSLKIVDALGFLTSTRYFNSPFPKLFWEASIKLYLSCPYST